MSDANSVTVEATGETVGEAKWTALRELEVLVPGLDRDSVEFQVVTEGERGLLGVGFTPAHVIASAAASDRDSGVDRSERGGPDRTGVRSACRRGHRGECHGDGG
jgi:predicted RNA-binding protein Jag